ncbi:hypothetical protein U1Q18_040258 [Sarracenia purpurea var. burkii]
MLSSKELREDGESPKASKHRGDNAIIELVVVSPTGVMVGVNAKDNTHASKLKHNKSELFRSDHFRSGFGSVEEMEAIKSKGKQDAEYIIDGKAKGGVVVMVFGMVTG